MAYEQVENNLLTSSANRICCFLTRKQGSILPKFVSLIYSFMRRVVAAGYFTVTLPFFTHYIYGFGTTYYFRNLDLIVLKILRKKVLCVFHGSDSRPPYLNYVKTQLLSNVDINEFHRRTVRVFNKVRFIGRWSTYTLDNFASSHFHVTSFLNHYAIGVPLRKFEEPGNYHEQGRVSILHCPSNPIPKGTPIIMDCMEKIIAKYPFVEFTTITGRPNSEVLEALRKCDFVIDQMYSDTPLAHFASESAALGKFSIVGGYGWSQAWLEKSGLSEFPSYVCTPDTLFNAIENLVLNPELRKSLSNRAHQLACCWDYLKVSARIAQILEGNPCESWFLDSADLPCFLSGGGLPASQVKSLMRQLVDNKGWSALCLDDKPKLLQQAKDFLKS
jgi:glycosyltransferase involved in cell wall biosynthesis